MSSPQHEPTMEEILASIRKIISEDVPAEPAPVPEAAPVSFQAESDILELTEEVSPVPPPPRTQPLVDDILFQHQTVAPVSAPAPSNDIFSDRTRKAMDKVFSTIPDEALKVERPAPAPLPKVDGASVESVFERAVRESFEPVLQKYLADNSDAVIERMKPLIREWMDEHFPALLEGAVRAEVERVARSRANR